MTEGVIDGEEPLVAEPPTAAAPVDYTPEVLTKRFAKIDVEMRRLWIRNLDYRNKIFAMQTAFIERLGMTVCQLGDPAADLFPIEIKRVPDAPMRIFAFGSMGANSGLPPKQFFNAFKEKHVEILFFKDFRQCWYQQGLLGLSRDIPSTIEVIRKLTADDPRPIGMIGASSGAFAALLFGALLGARKMVAFSPQTQVNMRAFHMFKTEDSVQNEIAFDGEYTDLVPVLARHPLQGTATIYFSGSATFDAVQAKRLLRVPGVKLAPLDWNGHNTAVMLRREGKLDAIIDDLCSP